MRHIIRPNSFASLIILTLASASIANAFSFNTSTPTQCGQMTVQWDGGQEPYYIVLVPTSFQPTGRIRNITVPTGTDSQISFELNEPAGLKFLATMYDSTGWGSGGTTPILTVGSSGNTNCLQSSLLYDFTFAIDPQSAPGQCTNMRVTWNDNVTYPVNLFGLIPSGTAWSIPIPQTRGQNTVDWQANIRQGTEFLLLMSNAGQYQTGGSTNLFTIGGGDAGCITDASPRSYASGGGSGSPSDGQNVVGVGGGSTGGFPNTGGGATKTNVGAIAGGVVGGVAFLVLLAILGICFCRRRVKDRRESEGSTVKNYGVGANKRHAVDLLSRRTPSTKLENGMSRGDSVGNPMGEVRGENYRPSPFQYPTQPESPSVSALAAGTNPHPGQRLPPSSFSPGGPCQEKIASPRTSSSRPMSTDRPSTDSQRTAAMSAGMTMSSGAALASSGVGRSSSTWKHRATPSGASADLASLGGNPTPAGPANPSGTAGEHGREEGQATYVDHQDAGPVIHLPPSYQQLRATNPD